jgi:putative tricarboxylic transport membrane protein
VLGFVLGPMIELSFRRSLILSDGSLWIFGERPISLVLLVVAALTFAVPLLRRAQEMLKSPPSPP